MSIMLMSEVRAKKAGKGRLRLWVSHFSYHSFKDLRVGGGKDSSPTPRLQSFPPKLNCLLDRAS